MKVRNKILILIAGFLIFLTSASTASALELIYPPVIGADPPQVFLETIDQCQATCEAPDMQYECMLCERDGYYAGGAFPLYIKYFYYLLIHVSGLACFYAFVSGGLFFFFAGDSPTKAKEGLNRISLGALGVIILLASVLVLNILNPALSLLGIPRIEPPEAIILDIPEVTEEFPAYVEIPLGGLIEKVRDRAATVSQISATAAATSQFVSDTSACLERLTDECECSRVIGEDPVVPTEECESTETACSTGVCLEDPCDINTPDTSICSDLGQAVDSNLRTAIESKITLISSLARQLGIQRNSLIIAEENLNIANQRLKMAEALMRNSISPAISFETFAGLNNKEIIRIFPNEIPVASAGASGDQIEFAMPGPECQGHSPQEDMPRCILCLGDTGDELVCIGNNYRCCATSSYISAMCNNNDSCANPPRHIDQEYCDLITFAGCVSPRTCSDGWRSAEDLTNGVGGSSFMYNGISYEIPAGGAYFVGSTVMQGCAAYR